MAYLKYLRKKCFFPLLPIDKSFIRLLIRTKQSPLVGGRIMYVNFFEKLKGFFFVILILGFFSGGLIFYAPFWVADKLVETEEEIIQSG